MQGEPGSELIMIDLKVIYLIIIKKLNTDILNADQTFDNFNTARIGYQTPVKKTLSL